MALRIWITNNSPLDNGDVVAEYSEDSAVNAMATINVYVDGILQSANLVIATFDLQSKVATTLKVAPGQNTFVKVDIVRKGEQSAEDSAEMYFDGYIK